MFNSSQCDTEIRQGTFNDVNELINICHQSFPESILWNGPYSQAKKWWNSAISSRSAETWICVNNSMVVGFCILITDTKGWDSEKPGRDGACYAKLFALAYCPKLVLSYPIKYLVELLGQHSNTKANTSSDTNDQTWIGLIAVMPNMRNRRLAKQMLQVCEDRTSQLGRHIIRLCVQPVNKAAIQFYEKTGFTHTSQTSAGLIYTKAV
jgi:GNAT superfamily N-acetyltransferase